MPQHRQCLASLGRTIAKFGNRLSTCSSRVAIMLAVIGLQGAGGTSAMSATLRVAHELGYGGRESLDPISPSRFFPAIQMIYDPLVQPDASGKPSPALALSWSASEDLKAWTFKLRPGVQFHNGSSFGARDVAFSLRRILSPKLASPVKSVLSVIDHVDVVDPLTVTVFLNQPHADFPVLLMDYRIRILSAGDREQDVDSPVTDGIGTGAFKIEQLHPDGTTTLTANTSYWQGKPGVDRIELTGIADADARLQALLAGQIDMATVAGKAATVFANRAGFSVQRIPAGSWNPIVMRTDTPPFTDVRVRKALKLLADRGAMLEAVLGSANGVVACDNPVWPGDQYYDSDLKCAADPAAAKELLRQAGFSTGLTLDLYASDVDPAMLQLAQVYQAQAAKVGVVIKLHVAPANGYWNTVWMKQPFVVGNWGQRPADQVLNEVLRSGAKWNETFWSNKDFDGLIDRARLAPGFSERKDLYNRAEQLVTDEGGEFIPFFVNEIRVVSEKLRNVPPTPEISFRWDLVSKQD